MKIVVSPAAAADIERLRVFLAERSTIASGHAVEAITVAIESLEVLPERGRFSGIPSVRELVVPFGTSAYLVRYAHLAKSEAIVILRIWHSREART